LGRNRKNHFGRSRQIIVLGAGKPAQNLLIHIQMGLVRIERTA
jgi:hypothetical protein